MPKIVDHEKRKQHIAEAVWRLVRREGIDGASVRRVAEEAGLTLGALRHYFDAQHDLLAYAMRLLIERVGARIERLPLSGELRADMETIVAQLVPLDEERLAEAEVWLAFAGKAVSDPAIRALSEEAHKALYEGFKRMIVALCERGLARPGIDPELEARLLHALVDGLVVHHTIYAEHLDPAGLMRIVSAHLDGLFKAE
ncbi:TetR family transcriptional regulator C-terminal domain-containing protein [Cohnella ginsengisoli]|uniref:TetR family transcriptional regulator C-terminal domain-containing protein n=1 Tax=Cohnella ginsengisoli TaxID=425004 RepID=A0A9X4QNT4_9BACL|nr:TetR family transcriptional regulator C-terminal domain-containing protein [Cohnella ginsengisoli]MDG0792936.1 TetR family transcriptional regulator C-terminal domain-containing protein [Cohnella ginsengisoli]